MIYGNWCSLPILQLFVALIRRSLRAELQHLFLAFLGIQHLLGLLRSHGLG
jgi:hypothetical protein